MSLDKFITPSTIKKTIDPGTGDDPLSPLIKEQKRLEDSPKAKEDVTPIPVLIQDYIELAQNTQAYISQVISDIDSVNSVDSGFSQYHQMVRDNYFNPKQLLVDNKARPVQIHEPNDIKAAERDVYRRVVDPRAPFVQDLYDHLSDAGISEYVLKSFWYNLATPNSLQNGVSPDNAVFRLALQKEAQHLRMLKSSAERIRRNKLQKLSYGFLKAFSSRIVDQVTLAAPQNEINKINEVLNILKQIRSVLTIVVLLNTENWEKFYNNIKDIYGNFLQVTASKVVRASAYAFTGEIQSQIFSIFDKFDEYIPFDLDLKDIPEAREFMYQINGCFSYFLAAVEDDFVAREAIQIKLEENRQLLFSNSQKNSQTKQFLHIIDQLIIFLESAKQTLGSINSYLKLDVDIITNSLVTGIDEYQRKVSIEKSKEKSRDIGTETSNAKKN